MLNFKLCSIYSGNRGKENERKWGFVNATARRYFTLEVEFQLAVGAVDVHGVKPA